MKESEKQVAIFFTLISFVIISLFVLFIFNLFEPVLVLLIILIVLVTVYSQYNHFFAQVAEYQRAVVFRKGKFKEVAGPGWVFFIPFIESYKIIDLRTKTYDIPSQEVVTRDNIKLKFDAILYLKVIDAKKSVLNVADYKKAAVSNIQGALRTVVGNLPLRDVISNVHEITEELKREAQEVSRDWGVSIESIEIQSIALPKEVQESMHKLKEAEQKKLAAKELAEGKKININAIQESAGKLTDSSLRYLYLQALQKIAEGKSSKLIFPLELSNLAANVAGKFGGYEKAQSKVSKDYENLIKNIDLSKVNTSEIIEKLKKEYGLKEEKQADKTTTKKITKKKTTKKRK